MERVRALKEKLGKPQVYVYVSTDYVACFNEYNKTHPVTEESFRLSPVSYVLVRALPACPLNCTRVCLHCISILV